LTLPRSRGNRLLHTADKKRLGERTTIPSLPHYIPRRRARQCVAFPSPATAHPATGNSGSPLLSHRANL